MDALSHCPKSEDNSSDAKSDKYGTISYFVVCDDLANVTEATKLPLEIKQKNQNRSIQEQQMLGQE